MHFPRGDVQKRYGMPDLHQQLAMQHLGGALRPIWIVRPKNVWVDIALPRFIRRRHNHYQPDVVIDTDDRRIQSDIVG